MLYVMAFDRLPFGTDNKLQVGRWTVVSTYGSPYQHCMIAAWLADCTLHVLYQVLNGDYALPSSRSPAITSLIRDLLQVPSM